jgi:hypothetical protein
LIQDVLQYFSSILTLVYNEICPSLDDINEASCLRKKEGSSLGGPVFIKVRMVNKDLRKPFSGFRIDWLVSQNLVNVRRHWRMAFA